MIDYERLALIAIRLPDGRTSSAWIEVTILTDLLGERILEREAPAHAPTPADQMADMLAVLRAETGAA